MSGGGNGVLISGAGRGIGKATAEAFARCGYHVVVTDVLSAAAAEVAEAIRAAGFSAEGHGLDVTDTAAVDALVAEVARRRGTIDVAVANAGVAYRSPLPALDDAAWEAVLDVNLKGSLRLLRAAASGMREAGRGSLIALSSTSALLGWDEHVHYNASKAGIVGLIRGLAVELGPKGIRANAVLPGVIRTDQSLSREHSLGPEGLAEVAKRLPLRRIGTAEEVAEVVVFLASKAARYITGQCIVVDGGLTVSSY